MSTIAEQIAALEAEAAAAEKDAKDAEPNADEKRMAEARERMQAARETKAASDTLKRANEMALRVREAETGSQGRYKVVGVDLHLRFPLGKSPIPADFPGGGVIVVRDAAPQEGNLLVELEHKNVVGAKRIDEMMIKIAGESVVYPDTSGADGIMIGEFFRRYPAAAIYVAGEARRLGGAKVAEAKRGRE